MPFIQLRDRWRTTVAVGACAAVLLAASACGADNPEQAHAVGRDLAVTSSIATSPIVTSPSGLPSARLSLAVPITYGFTGAVETVPVPGNATSMSFTLTGGSGGSGDSGAQGAFSGGRGGYGAVVSGTIAVTPRATVTIAVGGQGGHYGTNPQDNHGGWGRPSGGAGGTNPNSGTAFGGGGGGGATLLTVDGAQVAVAGGGGGGGAGGNSPFSGKGGDGGASGVPAHNGNDGNGAGHGDGGSAGTVIGGVGGTGGVGSGGDDGPGGGGGGGVLGGAGGHGGSGAGGGAGAGTCMYAAQVTSPTVSYGTALGDGEATITWTTTS